MRAGYGVTYNSGSYASIARQLVGQPPFATTKGGEITSAFSTSKVTIAASGDHAHTGISVERLRQEIERRLFIVRDQNPQGRLRFHSDT